MTLRTLNYGNYGIFLIMGNAGFCPSAVWGHYKLFVFVFSGPFLESAECATKAYVRRADHHFRRSKGVKKRRQLEFGVYGLGFGV